MATETALLFETPESQARRDDVEREIARLESVVGADFRNLYATGPDGESRMLPVREWPDAEAAAIAQVSPAAGGGFRVVFVDRHKAADMLARLKGMYEEADQERNPLESALSRIPRKEVVAMARALRRMAGTR